MGSNTTKWRSIPEPTCHCGCSSCPDCTVTEREYLVPVYWTVSGYASVMADTPEEAADKARSEHHSLTMYEEAVKMDESFEVDSDGIIEEADLD